MSTWKQRQSLEKTIEPNIYMQKSERLERKVVLIVDDSSEILSLHRMVLEMDDFKVYTALSALEALEILSQMSSPDLILLDVRMEGVSGAEFLVMLEEKMPEIIENVPVVFLTALDEVPPSKAVGFIRKAIDIDKFVEAVHHFIEMGTGRAPYRL